MLPTQPSCSIVHITALNQLKICVNPFHMLDIFNTLDPFTIFMTPTFWSGRTYEPRHEISNNKVCVTSKASDQPALICAV